MTSNHIGCTVYISTALPATNDAAGFEALSWTKVNGLVNGPSFGYSHEAIDIPDLSTGFSDSVKGMGSGRDTEMAFRDVASDTGQATVRTQGIDDDGKCAIKLGYGTGIDGVLETGDVVEYAQGYLHSYAPNAPTPTSYQGFTVNFRVNAKPVKDAEPA